MGLGLGCEVPPPCVRCPFHIGVVAAKRFAPYHHLQEQKYTDSFDNIHRAKDHIQWVLAKGDLIPVEGIVKTVTVIQKLKPTSKKTGRVIIVTSESDDARGPSSHFGDNSDCKSFLPISLEQKPDHSAIDTRQPINLDYNLSNLSRDDILRSGTAYRNQTSPFLRGEPYIQVSMDVEIVVSQQAARAELLFGRTQDMLGKTGAAGFRFDNKPIAFPRLAIRGDD
jgi:hypothetical protein